MKIFDTIYRIIGLTVLFAAGCLLSSCDGFIYEAAEECAPTYRLSFRYDKNLKWADAFANEVRSVRVHAYDPAGNLVKVFSDKGEHLANDGYALDLDLPPGKYRLVAWCGTDNDAHLDGRSESFSLIHSDVPGFIGGAENTGETNNLLGSHVDGMSCSLNRKSDDEHPAFSDEHLYSLFHGDIEVELPDTDDGLVYDYTMPLTKNTNHIRVVLNHLNDNVDVNDFVFHIEDANGLMDAQNNLLPDETIRYRTWKLQNGTLNFGDNASGSRAVLSSVTGAIADLTVGRMTADHREQMKLTITTKAGDHVATIPVIDCALMAKDYYEEAYRHKMSDQEFLDREDDYVLTLFLDENNKWSETSIFIHSWRVVLHDYDVD